VIKGYEVRGDDIYYDVEVWDKNGQSFFVPPMSSEMVRKVDNLKVATFLEAGTKARTWNGNDC
jgi:hypothetical protein